MFVVVVGFSTGFHAQAMPAANGQSFTGGDFSFTGASRAFAGQTGVLDVAPERREETRRDTSKFVRLRKKPIAKEVDCESSRLRKKSKKVEKRSVHGTLRWGGEVPPLSFPGSFLRAHALPVHLGASPTAAAGGGDLVERGKKK